MQRAEKSSPLSGFFLLARWFSRVGIGSLLFLTACTLCCESIWSDKLQIALRPVFEYSPKPWKAEDWPVIQLTPDGNQIHFLRGATLQVIDRDRRKVVTTFDYGQIPCAGAREFYSWVVLADRNQIVANYCLSLLLIDGQNFQLKKVLIQRNEQQMVLFFSVSQNGTRVAAHVDVSKGRERETHLVLFDTHTWTGQPWSAEPTLPPGVRGPTLNHDGQLIAFERRISLWSDDGERCGLEVREVSTGRVLAEWWNKATRESPSGLPMEVQGCPEGLTFVPGQSALLAMRLGEAIVLWDFEKQEVKRVLKPASPPSVNEFLLSPDGSLLVLNVSSPLDNAPDAFQEMVAWDVKSGILLYESRKVKWSPWLVFFETIFRGRDVFLKGTFNLINFSADGKYLLVSRYKQLTLYEVVRPAATQ